MHVLVFAGSGRFNTWKIFTVVCLRLLDQILEGKHLVRDIYAFKKGFPYPQLKLQIYKESGAYVKRQEQVSRSTI